MAVAGMVNILLSLYLSMTITNVALWTCRIMLQLSGDGVGEDSSSDLLDILTDNTNRFPLDIDSVSAGWFKLLFFFFCTSLDWSTWCACGCMYVYIWWGIVNGEDNSRRFPLFLHQNTPQVGVCGVGCGVVCVCGKEREMHTMVIFELVLLLSSCSSLVSKQVMFVLIEKKEMSLSPLELPILYGFVFIGQVVQYVWAQALRLNHLGHVNGVYITTVVYNHSC